MNKEIIFYKIPSILLVLLPFSLITGPFISDLSVTLIAVIFLIQSLVQKISNILIIYILNTLLFFI